MSSSSLVLRALQLLDVDSLERSEAPLVKFTILAKGEDKNLTSSPSVSMLTNSGKEERKNSATYTFTYNMVNESNKGGDDIEYDGSIIFPLQLEIDEHSAIRVGVSVLIRDKATNHSRVWPGVGEFTITGADLSSSSSSASVMTCELQENDMPYGELKLSYKFVRQSASSSSDSSDPASSGPAAAKSTKKLSILSTSVDQDQGGISEGKEEGDMEVEVVTSSGNRSPARRTVHKTQHIDTDPGGDAVPTAAARSSSSSSSSNAKKSSPARPTSAMPSRNAAAGKSTSTGISSVATTIVTPPYWVDLPPIKTYSCLQNDMHVNLDFERLSIRLHSTIMHTSKGDTDVPIGASATTKISIDPVPGKVSVLRSKAGGVRNSLSNRIEWNFDKKTAVLTMSSGDMRSRLFREGCVPALQVQATMGNENFHASVYLPTLLQSIPSSGCFFCLPLVQIDAINTIPSIGTIVFEASTKKNNEDYISNAPTMQGEMLVEKIKEAHASVLMPAAWKDNENMIFRPPSLFGGSRDMKGVNTIIRAQLRGIDNFQYNTQQYPFLRLVCRMSATNNKKSCKSYILQQCSNNTGKSISTWISGNNSKNRKKGGFSLEEITYSTTDTADADANDNDNANGIVELESSWPEAECLLISLFTGPLPEDEIGCVSIPVLAILLQNDAADSCGVIENKGQWSPRPQDVVYPSYKCDNGNGNGNASIGSVGARQVRGQWNLCIGTLTATVKSGVSASAYASPSKKVTGASSSRNTDSPAASPAKHRVLHHSSGSPGPSDTANIGADVHADRVENALLTGAMMPSLVGATATLALPEVASKIRDPVCNGVLVVCTHGFVAKGYNMITTAGSGADASTLPNTILKSSNFKVTMNLEPTCRSRRTQVTSISDTVPGAGIMKTSSVRSSGEGYTFLEMSSGSSTKLPLTWSSQQKKAPFLRFQVNFNGNSNGSSSGPSRSSANGDFSSPGGGVGGTNTWAASTCIDVASLTSKSRTTATVIAFVPVFAKTSSSSSSSPSSTVIDKDNSIQGWILMGLKYSDNNDLISTPWLLNRKDDIEMLSNICSHIWNSVTSNVEFPLSRLDILLNRSSIYNGSSACGSVTADPIVTSISNNDPAHSLNMSIMPVASSISTATTAPHTRLGVIDIVLQIVVAPLELSTTVIESVQKMLIQNDDNGNCTEESGCGLSLVLNLGSESSQTIFACGVQGNRLHFKGQGYVMLSLRTEKTSPLTSISALLSTTLIFTYTKKISSSSSAATTTATATATGTEKRVSVISKIIADSSILIPAETFHLGLPLDSCIALRDKDGDRFALLDISSHATSFAESTCTHASATSIDMISTLVPEIAAEDGIGDGMYMDMTGPLSSTFRGASATATTIAKEKGGGIDDIVINPESCIHLKVSFEEGGVTDADWWAPIEPFFECNLIPPQNVANTTAVLASRLQDRTPFLPNSALTGTRTSTTSGSGPSSSESMKWGLACHLSLPAECIPNTNETESSAGSVKWILAIVVRDAARLNCPEIGYARVGIPWSVLKAKKKQPSLPSTQDMLQTGSCSSSNNIAAAMQIDYSAIISCLEQWIDISPPIGSTKHAEGATGRIFIKINTYDEQAYRLQSYNSVLPSVNKLSHGITGIGMVSFWINKLSETAAGNEEIGMTILAASVSSHITTQNKSPADNNDEITEPFAQVEILNSGKITASTANHANGGVALCGTVPVSGGNSEVRIQIYSTYSKVKYCTSYPVLAATPKPMDTDGDGIAGGESDIASPIPALDLIISNSFTSLAADSPPNVDSSSSTIHGGNAAQAQSIRNIKRAPRLKIDTAFIPFVQGSLLIAVHAVKFRGNIEGKFLAKDPRSGCFRAVMGPESFAYSESFDLNVPTPKANTTTTTTSSSSSGARKFSVPGKEQIPIIARIALPIDTLQLANSDNSVATLDLSLLDLDSLADGGKGYCLGSGSVRTASLYHQSVRGAASSSLPSSDIEGAATSNGNRNGAVGASPWMPVVTDIVDKTLNRIVATVVLSVQFVATAIPPRILKSLEPTFSQQQQLGAPETTMLDISNNNNNSYSSDSKKSHIELTLKQAFLLADSDKSGSVSATELLQVIKATHGKDHHDTTDGESLFSSMLMSLGGLGGRSNSKGYIHNDEPISMRDIEQAVTKTFNRLDVDGDGLISWWEWRRVLIASLLDSHQVSKSKYLNLKDSILLGILAANDAILASNASPITLGDSSMHAVHMDMTVAGVSVGTAAFLTVPFIKLDPTNTRSTPDSGGDTLKYAQSTTSLAIQGGEKDPLDDLPSDLAPAKAVPRLQNMVKSLRYTNQSLTKRLENAIVQSHRILSKERDPKAYAASMRVNENNRTEEEETNLTNMAYTTDRSSSTSNEDGRAIELTKAARRAHDAELQQQIMAKALEFEKNRNGQLELELLQVKRIAAGMKNAIREKEAGTENSRAYLELEIQRHNTLREGMAELKKKKMQAIVLLAMFFKFKVLPNIRKKLNAVKEEKLKFALAGAVARRKYKKEREKRSKAISVLQATVRGRKTRAIATKKQGVVTIFQSLFRGKKARKEYQHMLLVKAAACFSSKYRSESIVKRCIIQWILYKRGVKYNAAVTIQSIFHQRSAYKKAQEHIQQVKLTRALQQKEREQSLAQQQRRAWGSEQVQRIVRGGLARFRVKKLKCLVLNEREEWLRKSRELEQTTALEQATRAQKKEYNMKRRIEISKFWADRDLVISCPKPELEDCINFWVVVSTRNENLSLKRKVEYTKEEIEEAECRFRGPVHGNKLTAAGALHQLKSLTLQMNSMEEELRNPDMQSVGPDHRKNAELQQSHIDLLEESNEIDVKDLGDAYAYLGDIYLSARKYKDALSAYDRSYDLSDNFTSRLEPIHKINRLRKLAFISYLQGRSTGSIDNVDLSDALRRCQLLLKVANEQSGQSQNTQTYAMAEVFCANIFQEASGSIDEKVVHMLEHAVGVLPSGTEITREASIDLKSMKVILSLQHAEESEKLLRTSLWPRLARIHSFNNDLRVLTVAVNKHTPQSLKEIADDADASDTDDSHSTIPYDHPYLQWFAKPSIAEKLLKKKENTLALATVVKGPSSTPIAKSSSPSVSASQTKLSDVNIPISDSLPSFAASASQSPSHLHLIDKTSHILYKSSQAALQARELRAEITAPSYELDECERPLLDAVTDGYMISYNESGDNNATERTGTVHGVDEGKRLIVVAFTDQQHGEGESAPAHASSRTGEEVLSPRLEFISFDHPHIHWFKDYAYAERLAIRKHAPMVASISLIPRPVSILQAVGCFVEVPSREADALHGDMYSGKVVSIDASHNIVNITYQNECNEWSSNATDYDAFDFDSPLIAWMKAPEDTIELSAKNRPIKINDAYGFIVEVKSTEPTAKEGDMYSGRVVYINDVTRKMEISFLNDNEDAMSDKEEYDYDSPDVAWMQPPSPRLKMVLLSQGIARKNREMSAPVVILNRNTSFTNNSSNASSTTALPSNVTVESEVKQQLPLLNKHSKITRPNITECIGYQVELQSQEESAEEGDMYQGVIVTVNEIEKSVKIRFSVQDGYESDYETVQWDSTELAWIDLPIKKQSSTISSSQGPDQGNPTILSLSPTKTGSGNDSNSKLQQHVNRLFVHQHSQVKRPNIQDAIGYGVEVQSHEPGAESGDMFPGIVVSVDLAEHSMRIMFEVQVGCDADFDTIDYYSEDIAWIYLPKHTNKKVNSETSPEEGATMKAGNVAISSGSSSISMDNKLMNENKPNKPPKPVAYIPHKHSLIDRPKFSIDNLIGYGVEVQSHEPGAVDGDMFPGTIHSVNEKTSMLKIKFSVEEGCDSDYDEIEYNSRDLAWMHLPPPEPSPRITPLSSPAKPTTATKEEFHHQLSLVKRPSIHDAIGYSVEIQSHEPGAEPGDMYPGQVVSVNAVTLMVRVSFEVEEGGTADFEDISYESHDLAWISIPTSTLVTTTVGSPSAGAEEHTVIDDDDDLMMMGLADEDDDEVLLATINHKESQSQEQQQLRELRPCNQLSAVPRPTIENAQGYNIEVQSHDPGSQVGDMFPAVVKLVNITSYMLVVSYEVEEGDPEDMGELDYDSPDIAWMTPP